ncbi:MAG TPA: T9SS type A sorting domain-containing protein, partial [Bacteroidia bacterium]|nr:T9SS type A sorting domain-containing protein [Bacteroidia bacterium]
ASGDEDLMLMSADLNGTQQWIKTYGGTGSDYGYDVKKTFSGGYVLAGTTGSFSSAGADADNAFLAATDANGNILWSDDFGGMNADGFFSVAQAPDSGFVAAGFTSSFGQGGKDVFVVRTDKNGNTTWMKSFGAAGDDIGYSLCITSSSDILVSGTTSSFPAGYRVLLLKIDLNGNTEWSKYYSYSYNATTLSESGNCVIQNAAGNYVIGGRLGLDFIGAAQPFLMCTDTSGNNISWCNYYMLNSGPSRLGSVEETSPGGGYIIGASMSGGLLSMIRVSSGGGASWANYYSTASYSIGGKGYSATHTSDGGFILTGVFTAQPDSAVALIKTDAAGNAGCNTYAPLGGGGTNSQTVTPSDAGFASASGGVSFPVTVTVASPALSATVLCSTAGIDDKNETGNIGISPNPSCGSFTVDIPADFPPGQQLSLCDAAGRTVLVSWLKNGKNFIRTADLAPGVYFYSITSPDGETTARGKMVSE